MPSAGSLVSIPPHLSIPAAGSSIRQGGALDSHLDQSSREPGRSKVPGLTFDSLQLPWNKPAAQDKHSSRLHFAGHQATEPPVWWIQGRAGAPDRPSRRTVQLQRLTRIRMES